MEPSGADPKTKTVLIVDDDESVLNLLEIMVRRDGFKVQTAADGERALLKLDRKPDALILDLMLPGSTSGFAVLQRLGKSPETSPPVIVVTALSSGAEIATVQKDPLVHAFINKPINQDRLLTALHRAMGTKSPHPPKEDKPA